MGSILFKAFHDLRDTMREKYGVEEIPYYVCVGINEKSPVRAINKTGVEFYDRPIGEFVKYYDQLKMALCNGYVIRFKWNGQPRTCIFARMTDGKTLHVAHFTDTDDYTWLTIGYDVNDGRFFVYCNYNINPKGAYQYAAERMTEVEVFNIEL